MKKIVLLSLLSFISLFVSAQTKYVDATSLNLIGKAKPTSQPYHRIDTLIYKGFTNYENQLVRCSAGLAIVFKTNSTKLILKPEYADFVYTGVSTPKISSEGFDLYIRKNGKWMYAESSVSSTRNKPFTIISDMDNNEKECLLYLPMYSELKSLQIGIDEEASIQSIPNPFRHKILIFGSSFTHGVSTSRAGMSYPMQIERNTGLYICSIACSGNSKLQSYFANYIGDIKDVDAIVFDGFSNPNAQMIKERLEPFVNKIREKLSDTPLIFVQTIYREGRNFNVKTDKFEQEKMDMANKLMKDILRKYKNVYFIDSKGFTGTDHVSSCDGVHPSDLGYWRWANNLQPKLLKILKKCNIK